MSVAQNNWKKFEDFLLGKPPESLYKTSALFTFIIILMLLVEDRGGNDLIILKN